MSQWVSEWVSQWVTSIANDQTRVRKKAYSLIVNNDCWQQLNKGGTGVSVVQPSWNQSKHKHTYRLVHNKGSKWAVQKKMAAWLRTATPSYLNTGFLADGAQGLIFHLWAFNLTTHLKLKVKIIAQIVTNEISHLFEQLSFDTFENSPNKNNMH